MSTAGQHHEPPDPRPIPPRFEADAIRGALEERLFRRRPTPVEIGRFVLIERAGSGAMGVVYRAYDPKLQRDIALKLVRPEVGGSASSRERGMGRLLREARAAARIAHPNVVVVHEVDIVDGDPCVAMEYVQGVTLRQWCAQSERGWIEILDMFIAAGRGLQAAHRVGVVHRDFKPDNVLIDADGRPRVVDFGLARSSLPDDETPPGVDTTTITRPTTKTRAPMGTLAYMAPEQFDCGPVSPRSDQFAFCVALWECLFGRRPYPQAEPEALRGAVATARREPPSDLGGVPRGLLATLERGLSPDPGDRFANMDDLLARLQRSRLASGRTRRRLLIGLGVVVSVSIGPLVHAQTRPASAERSTCSAATDVRAQHARRSPVTSRFARTGVAFAERSGRRVVEILDAYAADWEADAYFDIGEALVRQERHAEAIEPLERSLEIRARAATRRPVETAKAQLRLAEALDATGADPERAAALTGRATAVLARDPRFAHLADRR